MSLCTSATVEIQSPRKACHCNNLSSLPSVLGTSICTLDLFHHHIRDRPPTRPLQTEFLDSVFSKATPAPPTSPYTHARNIQNPKIMVASAEPYTLPNHHAPTSDTDRERYMCLASIPGSAPRRQQNHGRKDESKEPPQQRQQQQQQQRQ